MLEVSAGVQVVSAGTSQSDGRLRGQPGKDGRDRTMDASVGQGPHWMSYGSAPALSPRR